MPELSLQNIEQISHDISRQEISFSHLLDELIDHVCCDVENEMLSGLSFSEAYERVKMKFGHDCFRQIQKDTLYAVDFKYRNMRNTMKISGIAGTVFFGFAALFKIQHWPLAGVMMTLGAFILALIFLPSSLGVLWKETHNKRRLALFVSAFITGAFFIAGTLFKVQHWPAAGIILTISVFSAIVMFVPLMLSFLFSDPEKKPFRPVYIIASIGFVAYITGFLFKIQHWPFATLLIITGGVLLGFVSIPWYTVLAFRDERTISARFLYIIVAFVIFFIPGTLINLNLQLSYETGFYVNQEKQIALHDYFVKHNNLLIDNVKDSARLSKIMVVHSASRKILESIENIQETMIRESEEPGNAAQANRLLNTETGRIVIYNDLKRPFETTRILFPETPAHTELESALKNYLKEISPFIPGEKMSQYSDVLDPSNFLPRAPGAGSLMSGLHSLELMKNSILATESGAMNIIINQ